MNIQSRIKEKSDITKKSQKDFVRLNTLNRLKREKKLDITKIYKNSESIETNFKKRGSKSSFHVDLEELRKKDSYALTYDQVERHE